MQHSTMMLAARYSCARDRVSAAYGTPGSCVYASVAHPRGCLKALRCTSAAVLHAGLQGGKEASRKELRQDVSAIEYALEATDRISYLLHATGSCASQQLGKACCQQGRGGCIAWQLGCLRQADAPVFEHEVWVQRLAA